MKKDIRLTVRNVIDSKTKPVGSLGLLEDIAEKIACIQGTVSPELIKPYILVFAGDHGIAASGVSQYPQEVTYQMVLNFLNGGAAINVFCSQHNIGLKVIDAGVKGLFDRHKNLIDAKVSESTKNFLIEPAMTKEQCNLAIQNGKNIVKNIAEAGCNIVGFGEMGISNTSSASMIMHKITGVPLENCVGRGTGLDDSKLKDKLNILLSASEKHICKNSMEVLMFFGGFEIAEMCGAYLEAFENNMIIVVDGFIATSALLIASSINQNILKNCIFSHQSDESGHRRMLEYLNAEPILRLRLRLGEGTGVALVYPLIQSAVKFLNEMASFESAGVSKDSD